MVDFAKLREEQNKRIQAESALGKQKSDLELVNECLAMGAGEWANNFLLSIKQWLTRNERNYLSVKQKDKLNEIVCDMQLTFHHPSDKDPVASYDPYTPSPSVRNSSIINNKNKNNNSYEDDDIPF